VLADDIRHHVDLAVTLTDAFDGVRVIADFLPLDSADMTGEFGLVTGGEFQDFTLELVTDLFVWGCTS
jgi:hypothetical protein